MKRFLAIILFLGVLSAADPSPKQVGSSEVDFSLSWTVENVGVTSLKVFGFENSSRQTVFIEANAPFSWEKDVSGNNRMAFSYQSKGTDTIQIRGKALIDYSKPADNAPLDVTPFLQESPLVILNAKQKQAADQAVAGSKNDFEKLVRLTEFVHNYVTYDETYWNVQQPSDVVFDSKRGVCDEYSHLLLALMREEKIPGRLVAGFVFSGKKWDAHAWVEAFIDGRVIPADPTYNEVGYLDGTHIKFASGVDQTYVTEEVSSTATVSKPEPFFKISKFEPAKQATLKLKNFPTKTATGELSEVVVEIENNQQTRIAVPLNLIVPTIPESQAVKVIGEEEKLSYLEPFEKKDVSWKIKFPENLSKGFTYQFVSVITTLGTNASFTTEVNPENKAEPMPILETGQVFFEEKEGILTIKTSVTNKGNKNSLATLTLLLDEAKQAKTLEISQGQTVPVTFLAELGTQREVTGELKLEYEEGTIKTLVTVKRQTPEEEPKTTQTDYILLAALGLAILIIGAWVLKRK